MPERASGRPHISKGKLALVLTLFGILIVYRVVPSKPLHRYKTSASPSTLLRTPDSIPSQHDNTISLGPGDSSSSIRKLFVDRLHPRHLSPVTEAENPVAEAVQKREPKVSSVIPLVRGNVGGTPDEKHLMRSPLKWTEHRGPPSKHNSPKAGMATKAEPTPPARQKKPSIKAVIHDLVESTDAKNSRTGTNLGVANPKPSASRLPNKQESEPHLDVPQFVEQTADNNLHTSMNLGVDRPKPPNGPDRQQKQTAESHSAEIAPRLERKFRCLCEPDICDNDSDRCDFWRWWPKRSTSPCIRFPSTSSVRQLGDKKALIVHSESTSNENLSARRDTASVASSQKRVAVHHVGLVSRRVICDCGPYICANYRSSCKRWKEIPDSKNSVLSAPTVPRTEGYPNAGNDKVMLTQPNSAINKRVQSQRPNRASVTTLPPIKGLVSEDKHYIPAYWKNNDHGDSTTELKADHLPRSEKISQQERYNPNNSNSTYVKLNHSHRLTVADVFVPKNCTGKTQEQLHQCQSDHQAGIIFYSLLGVFITSILLLGLLKCYMCFRRRRNIAVAKNTRIRIYEKSGTSSHPSFGGDILSSKREQQGRNVDNSRRYVNLDGAGDSWPSREHRRNWNIFSRSRRIPGRISPIPQARAPRIPTLKLPKPVFATVRKVSGLGFEGMMVSYKKGLKGKATDISRVKWTSTV